MTTPNNEPSTIAAAESLFYAAQRSQACGLGHHAWMPWLPITLPDGTISRYETYCVNCRHEEQFDV